MWILLISETFKVFTIFIFNSWSGEKQCQPRKSGRCRNGVGSAGTPWRMQRVCSRLCIYQSVMGHMANMKYFPFSHDITPCDGQDRAKGMLVRSTSKLEEMQATVQQPVSPAGPLVLAVCTRGPRLLCLTQRCLSQRSPAPLPAHPCLHVASTASPQVLLILDHHLHHVSLFPASCFLHCSSCGLSSLCLLHLSAGLSRETPHVCPESPISSVSTICLHWSQLQRLSYSLSVKWSLLSDMAMSEVIIYFVYF